VSATHFNKHSTAGDKKRKQEAIETNKLEAKKILTPG
jgi:hypothetical protein